MADWAGLGRARPSLARVAPSRVPNLPGTAPPNHSLPTGTADQPSSGAPGRDHPPARAGPWAGDAPGCPAPRTSLAQNPSLCSIGLHGRIEDYPEHSAPPVPTVYVRQTGRQTDRRSSKLWDMTGRTHLSVHDRACCSNQ